MRKRGTVQVRANATIERRTRERIVSGTIALMVHGARPPIGHAQDGTTLLIGYHWAHGLRVHRSARGSEDLGSIPVVRRHSKRQPILSTARWDVDKAAANSAGP